MPKGGAALTTLPMRIAGSFMKFLSSLAAAVVVLAAGDARVFQIA